MPVRALWFRNGTLHLIDQRALPDRELVLHLTDPRDVAEAIRTLTVRGAPAIGVAAAYGMVLAHRSGNYTPAEAARLLGATRPTAVDLFVGIDAVRGPWESGEDPLRAADRYRREIVEECHRIGVAGAPRLRRARTVLTHCNAGALATVEWGTALAPIRVARDLGARLSVLVDETRPLLQGARLTAWELARERIPHSVIADNAAGHFLSRGEVDAVVVGADRIARNGDFANKIGTYEKAVVAHENGVPFYVAAPWSTFDAHRANGRSIPVEEREEAEVLEVRGVRLTPRASHARNPAFDVTPARYVTEFFTPDGPVRPDRLAGVLSARATAARAAGRTGARPIARTRRSAR